MTLESRDGKSLLIVSYADIARFIDEAFAELLGRGQANATTITTAALVAAFDTESLDEASSSPERRFE